MHVSIDVSLDMNEIEEISKKVSEIMDKYDGDMDAYMLDVSSLKTLVPRRSIEMSIHSHPLSVK